MHDSQSEAGRVLVCPFHDVLHEILHSDKVCVTTDRMAMVRRSELLCPIERLSNNLQTAEQAIVVSQSIFREPEPTAVSEILERLVNSVRPRCGERIQIKVGNVAQQATISANRFQLHEALKSLCLSAMDAILLSGVISIDAMTVEVHNSPSITGGQTVCGASIRRHVAIRISDTGCSVPIDVRDRIFKYALSSDDADWKASLNFSTVHGTVQRHNGWIQLESSFSTGTRIVVNLPLVDAPRSAPMRCHPAKNELPWNKSGVAIGSSFGLPVLDPRGSSALPTRHAPTVGDSLRPGTVYKCKW